MTDERGDILREEIVTSLKQSLKSAVNEFETATLVLGRERCDKIELPIRENYEARGIALNYGEHGRHGYWDGQFAADVAVALSIAITANLDAYLLTMTPSICPLYCRLKAEGQLEREEVQLAIGVLDGLLALKAPIPLPYTHIVKFIIKRHLLDRYCY